MLRGHPLLALPLLVGCATTTTSATPVASLDAAHQAARPALRAEFFGIPLEGAQDVVFLVDRSASMRARVRADAPGTPPTKLEAATGELADALRALPDGTRFNVVFFDEGVRALGPAMMTLDARSRRVALDFIRGVEPGQLSAAAPALREAYRLGARRVVLLSDGYSRGDSRALLAEARAPISRGLRFDTVGLGVDADATLLFDLAEASGGITVIR